LCGKEKSPKAAPIELPVARPAQKPPAAARKLPAETTLPAAQQPYRLGVEQRSRAGTPSLSGSNKGRLQGAATASTAAATAAVRRGTRVRERPSPVARRHRHRSTRLHCSNSTHQITEHSKIHPCYKLNISRLSLRKRSKFSERLAKSEVVWS